MLKRVFILFFGLWAICASAQPIVWRNAYGSTAEDIGQSTLVKPNGHIIVAGSTSGFGMGNMDFYLFELDSAGNQIWSKTIGTSSTDHLEDMDSTADGGYILCGYTNANGAGSYDYYLIKSDASGDTLWTRTYGNTGWSFCNSVLQKPDGGYVLCGTTYGEGAGGEDIMVISTDTSGNELWRRTYGGTADDYGNDIILCPDSSYLIAGGTQSFGSGLDDIYILRIDQNGDTLWTRTKGSTWYDYASSALLSADSGFVITGAISVTSHPNMLMLKLDQSGNEVWSIIPIGAPTEDDVSYDVVQLPNDDYTLLGTTASYGYNGSKDFALYFYSKNGIYLSGATYGLENTEDARALAHTPDNGYVMVGSTDGFGNGLNDIWVVKLDSAGNPKGDTVSVGTVADPLPVAPVKQKQQDILYPNPAVTFIHLPDGTSHFQLLDLYGRTVIYHQADNIGHRIDVSSISAGIYFYRIQKSGGNILIGRIIISH